MEWKRRLAIGVLGLVVLAGCVTTGEQMATREKPLYDRLDGKPGITAVVDDFIARVAADRRINRFFANTDIPSFKAKLVDQLCEASGGPCKYTGKDMKTAHAGMGVTDAEFNALVEDLMVTLDKFKVPEKEKGELLGALGPMKKDIVTREVPSVVVAQPLAQQGSTPVGNPQGQLTPFLPTQRPSPSPVVVAQPLAQQGSTPVGNPPSQPTPSPSTPAAQAQPRRALVIGNTSYPQSPLRNPGNDARAMATFLAKEAGFTVYKGRALLDVDRPTLVNAISDFADLIRRGDIVVFYFSGHGLERQGQNYLIPINFAAQNAAQLPYEAPTAQDIQKQLVAGEPDLMMMILDACRDLPEEFKSLRGRAGGRGLGFMSAVAGSTAQQVIMFATAPGTVASDGGTLGNGTFTHCFLCSFQQPGLDSRIAFGDVVQCVLEKTNQEQSPFLVTSQRQRFVFK